MFLNHFDVPSSRCYNYSFPYSIYPDSHEEYYLAQLQEREQRRRYQAALEHQAYLEALERERKRRSLEERRRKQYLIELERRRQEEEQRKKLYLAHLQQLRQEKMQEEMMRMKRAEAIEALMREEEAKRAAQRDTTPSQYQIVRDLDGNLYKVLVHPVTDKKQNKTSNLFSSNLRGTKNTHNVKTPLFHEHSFHDTKNDHQNHGTHVSSSMQPSVTFQNCFNVNQSNDASRISKPSALKKKNVSLKKHIKSSILIGDVEDASDSECEDEFSDYMHNRRPQKGEWIEPVNF